MTSHTPPPPPPPSPPDPPDLSPPDWEAIARFLAGESPEGEAARVRLWLAAHPADARFVQALDGVVGKMAAEAPAAGVDVEGALGRVRGRLDEPERRAPRHLRMGAPHSTRRFSIQWVGLAAAAALVVAVGVARLHSVRAGAAGAPEPAGRIYATAVGQRDSVQLADGSHVLLGPGSRLTVPAGFGATRRTVDLQGDAYFRVQHDPAKLFAVRTARAIVEDIGTTFAVESDPNDSVRVDVTEGAVHLRSADDADTSGVVLRAGDRGVVGNSGHAFAYKGGAAEDDVAWIHGRLVFHDASLARVGTELERWYGIHLALGDSELASRHVSTTIFVTDSARQVLRVLGLALPARVDQRGDTAVLRSVRVAPGTR